MDDSFAEININCVCRHNATADAFLEIYYECFTNQNLRKRIK
ncbi:Hypothetical protein RY67_2303 [Bifidobacterium longum subsp. infantis]|uniref:Uncharacterized protein n=1 Tax=Bifidobacterium longum subsp. infantis TaxID=1682 RepID=A0A0M4LWV1_BIFLI|nr:Hypothetical protein RY67_2303 [Bifidobacterium longum subsp. infantis]